MARIVRKNGSLLGKIVTARGAARGSRRNRRRKDRAECAILLSPMRVAPLVAESAERWCVLSLASVGEDRRRVFSRSHVRSYTYRDQLNSFVLARTTVVDTCVLCHTRSRVSPIFRLHS
jgi:hypothetical protein